MMKVIADISVKARVLRDGCSDRIRTRLDRLTPDGRIRLVAVMMTVFAVLSLYTLGSSLYDIYHGRTHRMEMEHAQTVELEDSKRSIDHFNSIKTNDRRKEDSSLPE